MKTKLLPSLDWDIKVQPLKTITGISANRKAIMRTDNGSVLGVMSNRYKPLSNSRLIKLCTLIERTGNFRIEGYSTFRNGKVVMAFMRNYDPKLNINGYNLSEYLLLGNSHDGSKRIFIGSSQNLVRCENQFTSTSPVFQKKHLGDVEINSSFAEAIKSEYEKERLSIYAKMKHLREKSINEEIIGRLVRYLIRSDRTISHERFNSEVKPIKPIDLITQSIRREIAELGQNAFGLFNGVTWYTSHELPRNQNNFGNVNGAASYLNERALEFCMEL